MGWHNSVERTLLVIWVGAILITGFIVTPVLFEMLESKQLAGNIAGHLFSTVSWIGLIVAPLLFYIYTSFGIRTNNWRLWLVGVMWVATVIGEFIILPQMSELKLAAGGEMVQGSDIQQQFSNLHILSSSLFIVNALFGMVLVVFPGLTRTAKD